MTPPPSLPGVRVRLRTGEGEVLERELRLIPIVRCCWAAVKELRLGARGVAVGVVETEEAAEFLRLLPRMGEDTMEDTMDRVSVLHLGDIAEKNKNEIFSYFSIRCLCHLCEELIIDISTLTVGNKKDVLVTIKETNRWGGR